MARLGKRQRALLRYAADGKLQLYRGWQGANDVHSPDDEARFREQEVERLADLGLVDYEPGKHFLSQNVVLTDAGRAALAADRVMRLTPREVDQVEVALDGPATVAPELADAIREVFADMTVAQRESLATALHNRECEHDPNDGGCPGPTNRHRGLADEALSWMARHYRHTTPTTPTDKTDMED